ncbi:type II secretion system protein [Vibrio sp. L3-7]|uniref:type II secretion system protein n=1 Tax=Vibrio sp. L3-7 TaxID=2912253 RepID=UPI0011956492|nr:type II secretion system protein [Vibrio sp. L3-7]MCF7502359.1 type II secretion system protein [Vibrio sp. L3-7]TVU79127.1 type II secretion system protein [Vibrio tasmaniensis]
MLRLLRQIEKWKLASFSLLMLIAAFFIYNQIGNRISRVDEATFLIGQLNTVLDAAEQYSHDNGSLPPITSDTDTNFGYLNINHLIENPGLSTWQGPYLPYGDTWIGGDQYIDHPDYIATQLLLKEKGSQWARGSSETGCESSSATCSLAACIWLVPTKVAQEINQIIDGNTDIESSNTTGKVRYDKGFGGALICMIGDDYPMSSAQSN